MGRPIKARYFTWGGPKDPSYVVNTEGVTVSINAGGAHYSAGATAVVSAPNDDGVNATVTLTINTSTGVISAATIANVGTGYTSVPTVTVKNATTQQATVTTSTINTVTLNATSNLYVGMNVSGPFINTGSTYITSINNGTNVVGLSANAYNSNLQGQVLTFADTGTGATFTVGLTNAQTVTGSIACTAYIPVVDGGTSAVTSAIVKQEGSHRYLVESAQGYGICNLVTTSTSLTPGQMSIIATDANGSTYFISKLTMNYALLWQYAKSGSFLIANGTRAQWTTGTAVGSVVSIATN